MTTKKIPGLFVMITLAALLFSFSCKKKQNKEEDNAPDFDKAAMLSNIGNNIILTNYQSFNDKVNTLNSAIGTFTTSPDSAGLFALRVLFIDTYVAWQKCSVFELGQAETELMRGALNTFPVDTVQINTNISTGTYNLSSAENIDTKGFPAVEFLLYGPGDITVTLSKYSTAPDAANRKDYLLAVVTEVKNKTNAVYSSWSASGGNYIASFISSQGLDIGSSTGNLVNQLNYDLELLKNIKIGIPSGVKSLGTPYPEKTEAYYSGLSLQLAKENLQTIENVYLGKSASGDGMGLDDYLDHLGAQNASGGLNDAIKGKFVSAKAKLNAIPETLSQSVLTNSNAVNEAYNELQQLVVLLKVDMTSALGVAITYQDNDGD